jgi:hypothetical protein
VPNTPINGLPSPDDSSPNDPPIHFGALNAVLDSLLVPRYTTGTNRDSAITAPIQGQFAVVNGQPQLRRATIWDPFALQPQSADRTTNIVGATVSPAGSFTPTGVGLTLPALPVGHVVVIFLSTEFTLDTTAGAQSLSVDIVPTGATKTQGHSGITVSTNNLASTVHTRQTFTIAQATATTFGSTYACGAGTSRAVLAREDWTVIL